MNENPSIRYYLPSHHPAVGPLSVPHRPGLSPTDSSSSGWRDALGVGSRIDTSNEDHLCKILAFMVQEELDMYKRVNPNWPEPSSPARPPSTLLITDRTMDMMAPFVHEFTYQAMANDLLPIVNGTKFRYEFQNASGATQTQVATLSEADTLWVTTRHQHIKEAIDKVISNLKDFQEQNGVFTKSGTTSIEDVKDMLAGLSIYQEGQQQCMDMFVDPTKKLAAMATIEQNCATGVTPEGKAPKTLVEEMVPLLADSGVGNLDKVRVIALYIMYRDGVPEEDRRRLYEHSKLSRQERAAVDNLAVGDRDTRKKLKNRFVESDYDLSRFRPLLKTVLEDLVANKLDTSVFPLVKDPSRGGQASPTTATPNVPAPAVTSLRNKPVWTKPGARVAGGGRGQENRGRIFVFVAGGMTYSEMRSAYELSTALNKEVYIEFIGDLETLDAGGQGSASIPGGLPDSGSNQQRSFQTYYDQKYMTKDEPPPPPKQNLAPPGNANGLPARPGLSAA
ncbi:14686_t:CDS:2, partial [Acaulospora colombiana]